MNRPVLSSETFVYNRFQVDIAHLTLPVEYALKNCFVQLGEK